ncbi:hypothetical protein DRP05_00040 [Archaeoglobales archaeon]|nr:MAG: hypothetical protein DRP05_00040 [Archaeoglobales archaeon]
MELIRIIKSLGVKKVLLFGMGGGGDIVGTVPTASFLKEFGVKVYHGSIVWDRIVVDPKPGPRAIEELENAEIVNSTVAIANESTTTNYGVKLTIARAARVFGEVVALDITKGVKKLVEGLLDFAEKYKIDLIVGMDSGGDALCMGFESGIKSPLADSICVATLSKLENSIIGVFGFGSDGELRIEELLHNISILMKNKGFLGCLAFGEEEYRQMIELTKEVITEASMLPLRAYEGRLGLEKMRDGRTVIVSPLSTLTFYFDSEKVFELNALAKEVEDADSINKANEKLNNLGVFTELDYERAVSKYD